MQTNKAALSELIDSGIIWSSHSSAPLWKRQKQFDLLSFGAAEIDQALPFGGLPYGTLHEFIYSDPEGIDTLPIILPTILAQRALSDSYSTTNSWGGCSQSGTSPETQKPFLTLWMGKRTWPNPYLLGTDLLRHSLFIDPPKSELLWCIETALRSKAVKIVIAEIPNLKLATSRRLCWAARASSAIGIILQSSSKNPSKFYSNSAATTIWNISPSNPVGLHSDEIPQFSWNIELLRSKGGRASDYSWNVCIGRSFEQYEQHEEDTAFPLRILSILVNRHNDSELSKEKLFGT